jgi:hypothetical protein
MNQGTPKTLDETIDRIYSGNDMIKDHAYYMIRDFISQKFAAAMLKSVTEEESQRLKELFNKIIKR